MEYVRYIYTHILTNIYEVCPEGIQPHNVKNSDIYWRRYKIQETSYIGQWRLSHLWSRHLGTSHSSPNHHQLLHHIFLNLISGLKSLPFQKRFNLGKSQKLQGAKTGLSHWVIWGFAKKLCMRRDAWVGTLSWWSCQSPLAHSCGLLNHLNSFCGGMFKLNAKFDADLLLDSLSHFECDSHTVHMLAQQGLLPPLTSTVKSSLFMHAHSSLFSLAARLHQCHGNHSCYINNGWTFSGQTLYSK